MSVITISRGSYSKGKTIADKLAHKLGYECISREILLEASEHFNIPEIKFRRALHDAPSILDRFTYGRGKYIAFIRKTLLEHLQKDNIVYHGLAGHFFLQEISHVIKVRIIANFKDRVTEEMQRENITEKAALDTLKKDDHERRKWSSHLYGIDTADASLYDVVLHVDNLKVNDAVDILADIAKRPCFQTTAESKAMFDSLVLETKAETAIVEKFPYMQVTVKQGVVYVRAQAPVVNDDKIFEQVEELLNDIGGIKAIRINFMPAIPA